MSKWKWRIVGYGEEDPSQLQANPHNWRVHPKAQQDALLAVLDKVGWAGPPVIVNRRTGHVVDGHLRVLLALRRGEEKVPVQYIDIAEDEERLVLATLDPIASLAAADYGVLRPLAQELRDVLPDVAEVLKKSWRLDFVAEEEKQQVELSDVEVYFVLVEVPTEEEQRALIERLQAEGYTCRAFT